MKYIYQFVKTKIAALLLILAITSCTDDFSEINRDPNSIAVIGKGELPFLFTKAQDAQAWGGQVEENLFADQYCQYVANVAPYFSSDQYEIVMDWVVSFWTGHFVATMPQLNTIMELTEPTSGEYALATIMMVYSTHRVTDYWGPIPYSKAGIPGLVVEYDSQKDIYYDLFVKLTDAVATLEEMKGQNVFGSYDIIYGGNVEQWIKFANTLRLRLAIRISKVDPTKAKAEAEAAYQAGVLEDNTDNAFALNSIADVNTISRMSEWNEFRMSAAMESAMTGYSDPRLPEYWIPAVNTGTYEGIRNGLNAVQLGETENTADAASHIGPRWTSPASGGINDYLSTPSNVMCAAEAYFLRAEGALLGWDMGGTVQELYETGISTSLKQWGITDASTIDAYIANTSTPIAPDDYLDSRPLNDIPVKFNESDQVMQNKQIAMQKWLALFPDGVEAWADYRRNPVLNLYPVANSKNPDIPDPSEKYIRRIPFLVYEYQSNAPAVENAINLLEVKEDKITTPVWWDVN